MTTNIRKWGNSQGVCIPKFILEALQWGENEQITISAENDTIVIKRAQDRKSIKELFENYHEEYDSQEIDWGESKGKEIW